MRFSRLKLTGFKSFVDPTDLIIADGLTGVVGPNGCGKSNLLEALRWVMGENRPTAMRGGGMEDVIFAGASKRPARGFAEVALHIDNTDRLAPPGFNDTDKVDIVRRITRDAGSSYKANGKEVRARDVQMLFADASTGAQSPALVRQGQISELINAKPKARRRVLEEAAGISGLYQRRHEAELKLRAAEANLLRVDDVVDQLASQLRSLAQQARQAARYRAIGEDLRRSERQLLFRRWADADAAHAEARRALADRTTEAARCEAAVLTVARARGQVEDALPPLREEAAIAAAVLQRVLIERAALDDRQAEAATAIKTLEARLGQLARDAERETTLDEDGRESVARLTAEAERLEAAQDGHEARLHALGAAADEAAQVLQRQEAAQADATEAVARLSARHSAAERLAVDSAQILRKAEAAEQASLRAAEAAQSALSQAEMAMKTSQTAASQAEAASGAADAQLAEADARHSDVRAREVDARAALSEADGTCAALRAEAQALARLVDREASEDGQAIDAVQVEPGYEKALGAALADDLKMPLVTGTHTSGWAEPGTASGDPELPGGVEPLSAHTTVPSPLMRRIAQIGIVEAQEDGARLQPLLRTGQRLVSRDGDLWRWDGFRLSARDVPSGAALRLEHLNRLEIVKQSLTEADAKAAGARQTHAHLASAVKTAAAADQSARQARRDADRAVAEASRALSRAEAERNLAQGKLESAQVASRRHGQEVQEARLAQQQAASALGGLPDLSVERAQLDALKVTVEAARLTMLARRSELDEARRAGAGREKRLSRIEQEIASWRTRLDKTDERRAELSARERSATQELNKARALPDQIKQQRDALLAEIARSEKRKAAADDALATTETDLRRAAEAERDAERAASAAREARASSEAREAAAREGEQDAASRIAEATQMSPPQLLDALGTPLENMPPAEDLEAAIQRLKHQRDALGAVNLRADEDARDVQTEHDTLIAEKEDLTEAIKTLRSGINALNREGRERLLTAFEQVNTNFTMLFKHLFGGGDANLVMVESDDPLEAGLEIMCQPPGKKLATLSLLSGGEQTLTALALIFAVFLANPAPICVLDEVDAPLDDANVTRFCDLLDEMCRRTETRFLIITHHAVTMSRMDRLFGVTMGEPGVSQLVSVDLKKAETLVA